MSDNNLGNLLSNFGDILNQQFLTGDNKNRTLNIVQDGHTQRYGKLGDFASKFDQSAERSYVEEGFYRSDFFNRSPKQRDILLQDPDVTVLVKKRMFGSLAENYRPDLADAQEKLFIKATKVLFQNKCSQISAYEKLFKIAQISTDIGRVEDQLLPILFAATDTLTQLPGAAADIPGLGGLNDLQGSINNSLSGFKSIVDRVREIVALSQDNRTTTWATNVPDSFRSTFGEGTGVIEFTNITSLTTTTTLKFAQGSFRLQLSDPYNLMLVTNLDIEQAISDATNKFYSNQFIQLGLTSLDTTIADKKRQLNLFRVGRGANPITFIVNPNTFLGKRVSAFVDNIGFEIIFDNSAIGNIVGTSNIDPSAKVGSEQAGRDGLNDREISIFNDIVSSIYTQLSLNETTRRQAKFDNQDPKKSLNSVRKKMRLHYCNKLVIQPMDTVHVFINSKKKIDTKIIGGLQKTFSSVGFLQGINTVTRDLKELFNIYDGHSVEKSIFVGDDFPNWLWLAMRSTIVGDKNGAHVFAGIVDTATSSYANGAFTATVTGSDNAGYFKYGVVNFKPSVDVFNGPLYDPLTPFKLEFDSVTGISKDQSPQLLDENAELFNSAFVRDKSGIFSGLPSTQKNFMFQDADRVKNNTVRRVFYDPDGMVYRWKEGIATLTLFGDSFTNTPIGNQAPAITDNPFAGQDVMNVLSLLITGEPYNFATFYKAATQFDTFKRDPSTNEGPSISYFRGFQAQLKQKNAIYGNFIPFKSLTMDEQSFSKVLGNQLNAIAFDSDLQNLIQERAQLGDKFVFVGAKTNTPQDQALQTKLKGLDDLIQQKISDISNELGKKDNPPITVVGNDISFDYDVHDTFGGSKTRLSDDTRKELRRKVAQLTKRVPWKVRANEDTNFLIVDDTYDKDYDIQAFEKTFVNPTLFKSEYVTTADKIENVASILKGMEVFANTQGHIEIRNPKYNRVPSSVFYRMFRMKDQLGIQVFPQFLEDLFTNQLEQLFTQIEVVEDEIRLYCIVLGKITDDDCSSFINGFDQSTVTGFFFLSDPSNGRISKDLNILKLMDKPDVLFDQVQGQLAKLTVQTDINAFSTIARAKFVQSVVPIGDSNNPQQFASLSTIRSQSAERTREKDIIDRLQSKTGQQFDITQLVSSGKTLSGVDILQVTNEIAARLSTRQKAIKLAANTLRNIQESVTLFKGSGGTGADTGINNLLFPDLNANKSIPKVFEHMIEDESYDDLGVGSSSRYVIKNRDIISDSLSENRAPWTSITVSGRLGDQFIKNNELPQDLAIGQQGNLLVDCTAVDYDMWRMYGLVNPQHVDAPYLTNPDTQCPAYAVSLLNTARKEIFKGTIDIVGNEYQQPGEVIYLEHRDQLFYVDSVTHNFTFGGRFSTSMEVSFGHNPGEYIPTWLDVIGKVLYKNKDTTHYVHKRQGNVFSQEHLGVIVGNYLSQASIFGSGSIEDDITSGPAGDTNRLTLQRIIEHASTTLSLSSDTLTPTLELRVYYNDATIFSSPSIYATQVANVVRDYLIGVNDLHGSSKPFGSTKSASNRLSAFESLIPKPEKVAVNASPFNQGENRAPSVKAVGFARDIATKTINSSITKLVSDSAKTSQQDIDNAIYSFIVDAWIVFKNPVNQ